MSETSVNGDGTSNVTSVAAVVPKIEPVERGNDKTGEGVADKQTLIAVLQFLRKHNLKDSESILRKEVNYFENEKLEGPVQSDSEVTNVLSQYNSEGDPDIYEQAYNNLKSFIECALDVYKHELTLILYPVFVHMYLELVYNGHEEKAIKFMDKFNGKQEEYYQEDVKKLSFVTKREHMKGNELMENLRSSHFTVRMSRETYVFLKRHLQEKKENVLLNIIQEHLYVDIYEGVPRNKQQVDATAGAVIGESPRQANKSKVYFGLLKEPDIQIPVEEDDEPVEGETDKPKKKKPKKDPLFSRKAKNDPNAPPANKIPFPELKDADKLDKICMAREAVKRVKLNSNCLPSICFYTFLNSQHGVICSEISEDSSLLAAGFSDSFVKVWTLVPIKLKNMKSASELSQIDKEADDVLVRMMDDRSVTDCRVLLGHSGPVYSVCFSPDRNFLLSCSEDATIRLWSLQTWTNLVCYKGHSFPVWDISFSPHGYYFASCGHDKTARVWATEYHQPLRIFAGHVSDVDCVQFHPNSHYIATGSADRSVRLWDVASGLCVRFMTGHKGSVFCLAFSNDGRFLASGSADKRILIWDIANGHLIAELKGHTDTVHSLAFSRDGTILSSGGLDCCVKLWDMSKLFEEMDMEDLAISHTPNIKTGDSIFIGTYPTKNTPILTLHFTRRNLLLGSGMYTG